MTSYPRHPTVVVGAGQAGLSVGYHLRQRDLVAGKDFLIVDAGPTAGGAWQHRWDSLRFADAHALADLPGMADAGVTFEQAPRHIPASEVVRERYATYESHYDLKVTRPVDVTRVDREPSGDFLVHAVGAVDQLQAQVVIMATGTWRTPRQPRDPGAPDFHGIQLTTPEFGAPEDFRGMRVAVVGGGASATGFVRELTPHADAVHWFTRRPVDYLDVAGSPAQEFGRESVRMQDEAAQAGRPLPSIVSTTGTPLTAPVRRLLDSGSLVRKPMFSRLVRDGAVLQDGTFMPLDAIVWAIGFHADLRALAPLGIDASEGVRVRDGHAEDAPGIFLAGYGPQASTISANRGARVIVRDAAQYLDDGAWPPTPPRKIRAT
ncbi:NAD(P)-binding domain-containing protein [Demequina flava]|uniref:NAD(P)-binding domain-containing protein n=1 Tax=Demequina flava TaxID=1095025 RepID=UPI0009E62120|nr:NAD(P)-binding domain-containing protein [Demequina flava]